MFTFTITELTHECSLSPQSGQRQRTIRKRVAIKLAFETIPMLTYSFFFSLRLPKFKKEITSMSITLRRKMSMVQNHTLTTGLNHRNNTRSNNSPNKNRTSSLEEDNQRHSMAMVIKWEQVNLNKRSSIMCRPISQVSKYCFLRVYFTKKIGWG